MQMKLRSGLQTRSTVVALLIENSNRAELDHLHKYTALRTLTVRDCRITRLPELPKTLREFHCYRCPLVELPELPQTLVYLNCGETPLVELPELPSKLESLMCDDNRLTSLPWLPDSLEYLLCDNNPWAPEWQFCELRTTRMHHPDGYEWDEYEWDNIYMNRVRKWQREMMYSAPVLK